MQNILHHHAGIIIFLLMYIVQLSEYNSFFATTGVNSEEDMQVSVTADVTTTNDLITFTCMIQDDSDTQGCIVILHNTLNISALRVNTVDKNFKSSFSRIPLPEGEDYLYAVFPWSNLTGLLEFEVVTKGIAPQIEGCYIEGLV